jgi:hypothetical protein
MLADVVRRSLLRGSARQKEVIAMKPTPFRIHVEQRVLDDLQSRLQRTKITEADIAKEKSKGGVYAKRAQFAENAKKWNHPGKGKK